MILKIQIDAFTYDCGPRVLFFLMDTDTKGPLYTQGFANRLEPDCILEVVVEHTWVLRFRRLRGWAG